MSTTPQLGQHFLTRPEIAGWVADAVPLGPDDTVLEIGPGKGILTQVLLQRAARVVALEKDPVLAAGLRDTFSDELQQGRLVLLEDDVRNFNPLDCPLLTPQYSLVANIPYYITGAIMRQFLTTSHQPQAMALLVQKEVAERAVAKHGKESLLSLSVKAYGTPRYVKTVKAGAFSPPPKVDSAILAVDTISRVQFVNAEHEERFFTLLHAGFASKRKLVRSNIKSLVTPKDLAACNIPEKARAEDLALSEWLCLSKLL